MAHPIKWSAVFLPDTPVLEIIVRGSVTYLAIFILLRIVLKRQSGGNIGMTDVLVIVMLADASQNGMAGNYNSIADGILLVAVIIFWSYILDWLDFHWPFFRRILKP